MVSIERRIPLALSLVLCCIVCAQWLYAAERTKQKQAEHPIVTKTTSEAARSRLKRPTIDRTDIDVAAKQPKFVYVGGWGAFHLGSAPNKTKSRGVFYYPPKMKFWSNSLEYQGAHRGYWHYSVVGTNLELAFATDPSTEGYQVWIRETGGGWDYVQVSQRGKPNGDFQ
ncbi:MAG TPA: hypothetical protein VMY37_06175 [Thermoguttaceae bacterium]|nr:hypothetical protein [Thermoguttaceae bacterium]